MVDLNVLAHFSKHGLEVGPNSTIADAHVLAKVVNLVNRGLVNKDRR